MEFNIRSFFSKCKRVWRIMKKPTSEEFKNILKISALGILAIGALGFLIAEIMTLFK